MIGKNRRHTDNIIMAIRASARKHRVSEHLLAAILGTESNFKVGAKRRCVRRKRGCYTDYGIGQIHISNIKARGWSKRRMLTDVNYSVEKAAIVLSEFQDRYAHREDLWFARYNCGTKSLYRKTCMTYLHKLSRFYNIEKEQMKEFYYQYHTRGLKR